MPLHSAQETAEITFTKASVLTKRDVASFTSALCTQVARAALKPRKEKAREKEKEKVKETEKAEVEATRLRDKTSGVSNVAKPATKSQIAIPLLTSENLPKEKEKGKAKEKEKEKVREKVRARAKGAKGEAPTPSLLKLLPKLSRPKPQAKLPMEKPTKLCATVGKLTVLAPKAQPVLIGIPGHVVKGPNAAIPNVSFNTLPARLMPPLLNPKLRRKPKVKLKLSLKPRPKVKLKLRVKPRRPMPSLLFASLRAKNSITHVQKEL